MRTTEALGYLTLGVAGVYGWQTASSYQSMRTWNAVRSQKQLSSAAEADPQGAEHQALQNAQAGYESALSGVERGALGAGVALLGSLLLLRS